MYLRFVLPDQHENSGRKSGVLVTAARLLEEGKLETHEDAVVREVWTWFNDHLPVPSALKRWEHARALSWFRPDASEPIEKMWELVHVLRAHGLLVELLKTDDPGIVIYRDEWQVVAKPRRGRRLPW
jgi:hypothetical protein